MECVFLSAPRYGGSQNLNAELIVVAIAYALSIIFK